MIFKEGAPWHKKTFNNISMKNTKLKKTLCKLDKHDIEENMDNITSLVSEPKYLCLKCARVSTKKRYLCSPIKIKSSHVP
jgi:hypothetical protein